MEKFKYLAGCGEYLREQDINEIISYCSKNRANNGKYHIIDKVFTGVGFTTAFIKSMKNQKDYFPILCCTNKSIVSSKKKEFSGAKNIYFKNKEIHNDKEDIKMADVDGAVCVIDSLSFNNYMLLEKFANENKDKKILLVLDEYDHYIDSCSYRKNLLRFISDCQERFENVLIIGASATPLITDEKKIDVEISYTNKDAIIAKTDNLKSIEIFQDFKEYVVREKIFGGLKLKRNTFVFCNTKKDFYNLACIADKLGIGYKTICGADIKGSLYADMKLEKSENRGEYHLTLISSCGNNGLDIVEEMNDIDVYLFTDYHNYPNKKYHPNQIYQAVGRFRNAKNINYYISICNKQSKTLDDLNEYQALDIVDNIREDIPAIYKPYIKEFQNKKSCYRIFNKELYREHKKIESLDYRGFCWYLECLFDLEKVNHFTNPYDAEKTKKYKDAYRQWLRDLRSKQMATNVRKDNLEHNMSIDESKGMKGFYDEYLKKTILFSGEIFSKGGGLTPTLQKTINKMLEIYEFMSNHYPSTYYDDSIRIGKELVANWLDSDKLKSFATEVSKKYNKEHSKELEKGIMGHILNLYHIKEKGTEFKYKHWRVYNKTCYLNDDIIIAINEYFGYKSNLKIDLSSAQIKCVYRDTGNGGRIPDADIYERAGKRLGMSRDEIKKKTAVYLNNVDVKGIGNKTYICYKREKGEVVSSTLKSGKQVQLEINEGIDFMKEAYPEVNWADFYKQKLEGGKYYFNNPVYFMSNYYEYLLIQKIRGYFKEYHDKPFRFIRKHDCLFIMSNDKDCFQDLKTILGDMKEIVINELEGDDKYLSKCIDINKTIKENEK